MDGDEAVADRRARELLTDLGFTEYEAACLVAIMKQPGATAADIARASPLPRSRVYDVADELAAREFVEVEEGEPRRYRALPVDEIKAILEDKYEGRLSALDEALDGLERIETPATERCSLWSFTGRRSCLSRSWELMASAEDRVWLFANQALLSPDCIEHLQALTDRDVPLTVATDESDLREWLAEEVPDATFVDVPETLDEVGGAAELVRVLLIDDEKVLAVTRSKETPASQPEYVGSMGQGEQCGFVLLCRNVVENGERNSVGQTQG